MNISGLSGLRGCAMMLIILYHLNQIRPIKNLSEWNWELFQFIELLPVVVSIFFILGGFLRSLSYWRIIFTPLKQQGMDCLPHSCVTPTLSDARIREYGSLRSHIVPRNDGILEFWKGVKDRFLRIAPLFYLALVASFCWSLYLGVENWKSFLVGFTFFSWVHPDTFFPVAVNGPLWFVVYDMMGNLLVMIVMSSLISLQGKLPGSFPSLRMTRGRIIGIWFVLIFVVLVALHFAFISLPFPKGEGIVSVWFPYYNPFIFGIYYLAGVALAGVYLCLQAKNIQNHIAFDALFLVCVGGMVYFLSNILGSSDLAYSWPKSPYRFPLVPILILGAIFSIILSKYVAKLMDNRFFLFVAKISYPLYLFHALFIDIGVRLFFSHGFNTFEVWLVFAGFIGVLSFIFAYILVQFEALFFKKSRKT